MRGYADNTGTMSSGPGSIQDNTPVLCTIGYEGLSAGEFLERLQSNKISCLVDVREVPLSRKLGFSAAQLRSALNGCGIEYVHMKQLGSPGEARKEFHAGGDFAAFSRAYESHLSKVKREIDILAAVANEKPTAIMCYEKDVHRCHRGIIASKLREMGFSIRDL